VGLLALTGCGSAAPRHAAPLSTTSTTVAPGTVAVGSLRPVGGSPIVVDAGNSMIYDAEPPLRAALAPEPLFPHTIGGFGISVQPEIWRKVFGQDVLADRPSIVVVMLGNRDFSVAVAQPDVYRGELDESVRLLTRDGARVLWLGLPPLPPNGEDERGRHAVNALFAELPARFPGMVRYVPTDGVLGGPTGGFTLTLPDATGAFVPVRKRNTDGTPNEHLCPGGAIRLTQLILGELSSVVSLPAPVADWEQGAWRGEPRYDDPPGGCRQV
jgi:hypothetical protein